MKLRIATRRSALALAQTRATAALLQAKNPGLVIEEVQIVTEGDRVQDRSLAAIGGKGLFIKELETALLDGRADLAVHSMKDLPADLAEGLHIVCVPERESPWDLLVTLDGRALADVKQGATVGTSSLRRKVQLEMVRPDLRIEMLRGNVDTRLRKLREGQFDAIVIAEAGVRRLGTSVSAQQLATEMVPAIGQGALALEARGGDELAASLVSSLRDEGARVTTSAERAVLRALGGSCVTPVGAHARIRDGQLEMRGFLASTDGVRRVRADVAGPIVEPEELGRRLARELSQELG